MIRYLLSLLLFFAGVTTAIYFARGTIANVIDVPTFIIVVIMPFLFVSVLYGFKEMKSAFSAPFKKEPDNEALKKASGFFNAYGKIVLLTGIIGVIIGVMGMFANIENANQIGPNMALSILSVYYSCIVWVTIVIPFTVLIKKQLGER